MLLAIKTLSCCLFLFLLSATSTCFALNFDALIQEKKTPIQITASLNQKVTKEVFFAVIEKRFDYNKTNTLLYRLKTLDIANPDVCFLAFDRQGNLINTGTVDEDCTQDGSSKFDFKTVFFLLLKNSYGYKPTDTNETANSLVGESGLREFDELQKALHSYYRLQRSEELAKEYLDRVAAILQKWKKSSNNAEQTVQEDRLPPGVAKALMLLADDYDKFLEKLSKNNYF